jgi:hypothetical protein
MLLSGDIGAKFAIGRSWRWRYPKQKRKTGLIAFVFNLDPQLLVQALLR